MKFTEAAAKKPAVKKLAVMGARLCASAVGIFATAYTKLVNFIFNDKFI